MAKKFLTPISLLARSSDPATASEGDIYFNTSIDTIKMYSNGEWSEISGGGAEVYYQSSQPSSPAIGDIWVDSDEPVSTLNSNDFMLRSDGTFTGTVNGTDAIFTGNVTTSAPTLPEHSATKGYVDSSDSGLNPFFLGGM